MEFLYQDDRLVVCVKPAGVLSTDEPDGMPSMIRRALGGETAVISSVHRLDRVVGGVMVYARTRRAAADLSRQITGGTFFKEYLAVVHGAPPEPEGTFRDFLFRDRRERRTYIASGSEPGAQEAVLDYRIISSAEGLSLLSVRLHTGRTHQIRCQLSGRGMPIVGDRKYGSADDGYEIALWSNKLEFSHPRTGERLSFSHTPPDIYPWTLFIPDSA